MSIFQAIQTKTENESFYISSRNEFLKCYSIKSMLREGKTLAGRIAEAVKKRRKLIWIAPFHSEIYKQIPQDFRRYLVWISPVGFTPGEDGVIDNPESLKYFELGVEKKDAFEIATHPCLKDYPFIEEISEIIKSSAARIKTIVHFKSVWENNFRRNKLNWQKSLDISQFISDPPDLMVLGGPSVDKCAASMKEHKNIWCCDTALPSLLSYRIVPAAVFSLDAGFASYEHFISAIEKKAISRLVLILDPLSFPALYDAGFSKTFSYASSNPLIQGAQGRFTVIENSTNDVFGLMIAAFDFLYQSPRPLIVGHDGGQSHYVTHLRGSAYHARQYQQCGRISSVEQYFFHLSRRYGRNILNEASI